MPRKEKPKDPAAVKLAEKRWEKVTAKKRSEFMSAAVSKRWENATEEERAAVGAKLAAARAAKRRPKKAAKKEV